MQKSKAVLIDQIRYNMIKGFLKNNVENTKGVLFRILVNHKIFWLTNSHMNQVWPYSHRSAQEYFLRFKDKNKQNKTSNSNHRHITMSKRFNQLK